METAIVSKTFSPKKYKDLNLLGKSRVVLEQMTNNAYFPDIQAKLDELKVKIQSYETSIIDSNQGGRSTTLIKAQNRRELENYLKELADYVQQTSKGAENIIFSAGFDTHKKPSRVGRLDRPTRVMLKMGSNKGAVWLSCDVVDRALFYVFEYCLAPLTADSVWIQLSASKRKILIEGLISGQEYCFRVAAARTHPSRNWSDPIKSYVI
ncbi:MAG: fibronectin type III domain-containing protein [Paludibacter sp.]|nr:fibronectin type III domain-containing protein [Paludibacter sp.]